MRIFLDTEYTNIVRPLLISVGFVTEDGREFYAELTDGRDLAACSTFVTEYVLPLLQAVPAARLTRIELRQQLPEWVRSLGESATIIYDLCADWRVLSAVFDDCPNQFGLEGRYLKWHDSPMEQRFAELYEAWFDQNGPRHHALVDARALRAAVLAVEREFRRYVSSV